MPGLVTVWKLLITGCMLVAPIPGIFLGLSFGHGLGGTISIAVTLSLIAWTAIYWIAWSVSEATSQNPSQRSPLN